MPSALALYVFFHIGPPLAVAVLAAATFKGFALASRRNTQRSANAHLIRKAGNV